MSEGSLWPPVIACILILLMIGFCSADASAYCMKGVDGNWYTDETPEETFEDPKNFNFRLKPGSCAIGKGVDLPEVTHDIVGTKRPKGSYDIGAYQSVPAGLQRPEGLRIN